ncbi:MAG: NAD-dependent epimerase/dehydratase family protein [Planctomycetota bacterium]|jgi:nucleoside-diphosphate-sugar epimerase
MIRRANGKGRILITGGAGYVGSTLIRDALADGFLVRCLDLLVYGGESLKGFINHPHFEFIRGDIRDKDTLEESLKDVKHVVHLAAVVGDLPCRAAPRSAVEINFGGTRSLAETAVEFGVSRFVFASTCSNYGIVDPKEPADEKSELNPVSLYAETKMDCERYLNSICDEGLCVTCLRFGTGYGVSFRTRFDLLVNSFAYEGWTKNEIVAFAANTWRPYIHVGDMSLVIRKILDAPVEKVRGETFNAGSNSQNYVKRDIVKILKRVMVPLSTKYIDSVGDRRNYRVNFDKLEKVIGFKPSKDIEDGLKELICCFKEGILTESDFENNKMETLEKFFGEKENELQSVLV